MGTDLLTLASLCSVVCLSLSLSLLPSPVVLGKAHLGGSNPSPWIRTFRVNSALRSQISLG